MNVDCKSRPRTGLSLKVKFSSWTPLFDGTYWIVKDPSELFWTTGSARDILLVSSRKISDQRKHSDVHVYYANIDITCRYTLYRKDMYARHCMYVLL